MGVLADAASAARHLMQDGKTFGAHEVSGRAVAGDAAMLEMTLDPLPALARVGYPAERVRIVVLRDLRVFAYVLTGRERTFKHRNPWPSRSLCLFYDQDDPALVWRPEDGLEEYVELVRRHLAFEEYHRRHGKWPCEDAPHGRGEPSGHPIMSEQMRTLRRQWERPAA